MEYIKLKSRNKYILYALFSNVYLFHHHMKISDQHMQILFFLNSYITPYIEKNASYFP